ncbi:MAG TPA: maleylpyruvate isomerase family mycothiol-dependent enzyme [Acidimicrobiales bacterium]|nr:maleylpyruvate isomerase family mycothiol-dependent enzyme [Acidimicrobiales bacterium]
MSPAEGADALRELRFALAEADAEAPPNALRDRIRNAALEVRSAGRPASPPAHIPGVEVFRRTTGAFDALIAGLATSEWARPALRDLDVQGLVGHLIGVETHFRAGLEGGPDPGPGQHVPATDPFARSQAGRPPSATREEWSALVERTVAAAGAVDPGHPVTWYGISLPLDLLLVVRAFEVWVHDGDIRRATGRPAADPDAESLARMTDLAVTLLPAGIGLAGRARPGRAVRLVLTGPGGGTWDVGLDPAGATDRLPPADARIVVDGSAFCRVVGNRSDRARSGGLVTGDEALADDVFAGAAALALD